MLEKRAKRNDRRAKKRGWRTWSTFSFLPAETGKAEVRPSAMNSQTEKKLNQSLAILPLVSSWPPLWPEVSTPAFLQKSTSDPYHLLFCSSQFWLQMLQYNNHIFPTLWVMLPHPGLQLLRQDGQELLQHQQLQDLLLGVGLGLQPLSTKFPELAQCFSRSCGLFIAQLPELFAQWLLPEACAVSLQLDPLFPSTVVTLLH